VEVITAAQSERDVYLVLDQAEEYFLYHADDSGAGSFAEFLPALLATPLRVNVLVSLREDSLAKLDRFTGRISGLFANTLRLDRLDRASASAAIVKPAARFEELTGDSVVVEPALLERVLDEVGAGRIEPALGGLGTVETDDTSARIEAPYLQLVMQRIWDEERLAGSAALRLETFERLGGAQRIVEEHLEGALAELAPEEKDVAARLFSHLVTPSGTKIAHEVSDLADFGQVGTDDVLSVLDRLSDRRILRSLDESGARRYEIFHDVLAQPVLAWRARHRTERAIERQLEERATRRSRMQRLLALALALALVLLGAVLFAVVQQRNASEKSRDARARTLDAAAIALLSEDPELSLLLARESAQLAPGPTAEDALLQSLLTSRVRATFETGGPISTVGFVPGARAVAYVDADGVFHVTSVRTRQDLISVDVGRGAAVTPSADGTWAVVRTPTGPPTVIELDTGRSRCTLEALGGPAADAVPADDRVVAVRNGVGSIWDARTCAFERRLGRMGPTAVRIVPSPDGARVAFLSGRQALVVPVERPLRRVRLQHPGEITSLAFGPQDRIVTGGRDKLARIWNGRTGRRLAELAGHSGQVLDVAYSPLGTEVATASTDGTARIWRAEPGEPDGPGEPGVLGELIAPLASHTDFVRTVQFAPDGASVVTSSDDGTALMWSLSGTRSGAFAGHAGRLADAVYSNDGALVATAAEDGTIRVWETGRSPDLVKTRLSPPTDATTEARSPTGDTSAAIDGSKVLLTRDGETVDLDGHRMAVTSVAFSPDGRRFVSASRDSDLILWDAVTASPLRRLRGHFGAVSDARFSPDGRWIVSAGPRSVGLWRASDGRRFELLMGPPGPFRAVAFTEDSRTIVARTEDGAVVAYRCRICGGAIELLALADERLGATGRELTPEERALYG
jgi:WD40 repeat protein